MHHLGKTRSLWSSIALTLLVALPATAADIARYILPPGNYGGVPFTVNSTDQLPLYAGLTPLRDNITPSDINQYYLAEDFQPIGATTTINTGRPGLQLIYDSYGVPHITGQTRDDVSFGAGWATARDRFLLLSIGRGPARVAVADVPNIDAFSLVTSLQAFTPSPEAEALVTEQVQLLNSRYGAPGRQVIADAQAYADGVNAYLQSINSTAPPLHGERRRRGDGVHRLDLRRRRWRRGGQLGPAGQAAAAARQRPGLQGVERRDAGRRSRGADHDHAALRVRTLHRRPGHRLRRHRRRVDPEHRSAAAGGAGGGSARPPARIELPGRRRRRARRRATRSP